MFVSDETVPFKASYYYYLITRQNPVYTKELQWRTDREHESIVIAYNTPSFISGIIFKKINEEHKIKVKGNSPFHRKQER